MNAALNLLDQIIEVAKAQDEEWKKIHQKMHKSSQTIGEGFVSYHLQVLRELLLKEQQNNFKTETNVTKRLDTHLIR